MSLHKNIYSFTNLSSEKTLLHGISTKKFGSMKQPNGSLDCDNLEHFRNALKLPTRAVCMRQVHSANVHIVDSLHKEPLADTDGLITTKKHIPLAVVTADCLPILFYDTKEEIIGVAHAGYKGVSLGIIAQMVHVFKMLGSDPKDILVGIGPSVGGCCYAVSATRTTLFQKTFPDVKGYVSEKDGKSFLDLPKLAVLLLEKEGVSTKRIEVADLCTAENTEHFYSYRKGDIDGRFVSIIAVK